MTAQVAVMNTLGIALATDSAVSVGPYANKIYASKIYASTDKLFQLVERAPVAIMISGNADFLGVPWETVIKVYKNQLGHRTFDRLSEYADDFFGFIQSNTSMFPYPLRDEYVERLIVIFLNDLLGEIQNQLDEESNQSDKTKNKNVPTFIHKVVMERIADEKNSPKIKGFGPATIRDFQKKHDKPIVAGLKEIFKEYSLLPKTKRYLNAFVVEAISRTNFDSLESEIVFAGFGEGEYMPSLLSYEVEGVVGKRLRYVLSAETRSSKFQGWIDLFGQKDIMESFLHGINPGYRHHIEDVVEELIITVFEDFDNMFPDVRTKECQEARFASLVIKRLRETFARLDDTEEDNWIPIFNMVQSMPKDELSVTAETLVNLTKFRLRISDEQETVGGPIDVAVITKGDGFVWVKRKHYFPAELNLRRTTNHSTN